MKADRAATSPDPNAPSAAGDRGTGRLRRAEARALTRRRLLETAAVLFAERGFRATSIEEVAERAGYSIGAVYSNFSGKDDLFLSLMRERLQGFEDALSRWSGQQAAGGPPPADLSAALGAELDQMERNEAMTPPGWWRLLAEFRAYAETNPEVQRDLLETEARCRRIIARDIERISGAYGLTNPMPADEMAEVSTAILDGLRAAHAQGRLTMTAAEAYRRVVAMMIESTNPGATTAGPSVDRTQPRRAAGRAKRRGSRRPSTS